MPAHSRKRKNGKKKKNGMKKRKGLTAAQKKLPKALQKAILKKLRRGLICHITQENIKNQKRMVKRNVVEEKER